MIISSPHDYRELARRRLPPFLFHYIDGGAGEEITLRRNRSDLQAVDLPQRVLRGGELSLQTSLLGETYAMPVALAPVGLTGMYARRGEVQAARAADACGIPMTLSTVSVCSLEEVQAASVRALWFQLYVLKDRGFMRQMLDRAAANGTRVLVFTADMPVPGARYRDAHSGMSGPNAAYKRVLQAMRHPRWALDVGLRGRPHDLGNISAYLGRRISLEDYVGWLGANFDPSVTWRDLAWIRDYWQGPLVIKGVLTPEDAREAAAFGAQGVVVSNHGGRQQDGAPSSARALPAIADSVGDRLTVLADSGVRSGADVARMIRLGAHGVLIGRAFAYALAADGERGVGRLLDLFDKELTTALTLSGCASIEELRGASV